MSVFPIHAYMSEYVCEGCACSEDPLHASETQFLPELGAPASCCALLGWCLWSLVSASPPSTWGQLHLCISTPVPPSTQPALSPTVLSPAQGRFKSILTNIALARFFPSHLNLGNFWAYFFLYKRPPRFLSLCLPPRASFCATEKGCCCS